MTDTRGRIALYPELLDRLSRVQAAYLLKYGHKITHRDLVEQIVEQYEKRLNIQPPDTDKENK
jgi:hypothetical protein